VICLEKNWVHGTPSIYQYAFEEVLISATGKTGPEAGRRVSKFTRADDRRQIAVDRRPVLLVPLGPMSSGAAT
jgi:hypothetical protein